MKPPFGRVQRVSKATAPRNNALCIAPTARGNLSRLVLSVRESSSTPSTITTAITTMKSTEITKPPGREFESDLNWTAQYPSIISGEFFFSTHFLLTRRDLMCREQVYSIFKVGVSFWLLTATNKCVFPKDILFNWSNKQLGCNQGKPAFLWL